MIIMNPCAGLKKANRFLTDIVVCFSEAGYACAVQTTTVNENGYSITCDLGKDKDLIVCIGGDGTFNEVVAGVLAIRSDAPIGYIPTGSTNDFASSLGLSKSVLPAVNDILTGIPRCFDAGSFNGRIFTYVASCGAFTKASYSTPRDMKNALGHIAYILEGIKSIPEIQPIHLRIDTGSEILENDYIFAAACNSISLGGILRLNSTIVDMSDGLLELLLIQLPQNMGDLTKIIYSLNTQNYNNSLINLLSSNRFTITAKDAVDWSLDGECESGNNNIVIENLHNAVKLIVPQKSIL